MEKLVKEIKLQLRSGWLGDDLEEKEWKVDESFAVTLMMFAAVLDF
jgi:hypothetical protein